MRQQLRRSGFTLVEVLVALAIVGGLLATLIVTVNQHLGFVQSLEQRLRLQDAGERIIEEMVSEDRIQEGESTGTLEPDAITYHVRVSAPEGMAAGIGVRWIHLRVEDGGGSRQELDLWVPR